MQFTCNKNILSESINIVQKASLTKTTLPILKGIKLEADKLQGTLTLTSNNLEMAIESTISANVIESGTIVINSKFFSNVIRKFSNADIIFKVDSNHNINITCGFAEFNTIGIISDEFPDMPKINDAKTFTIEQSTLKSMLKQTSYAIAPTSIYSILTGALFEIKDNYLNIVSVDGYRLAMRKEKISQTDLDYSFVMPGKTITELSRILQDDNTPVTISFTDKHVLLKINNFILMSNLLNGNFFDYKKTIPETNTISVTLNPKQLFTSIERASLVLENSNLNHVICCDFNYDEIKISCSNTHTVYHDKINTENFGEKILIGLNIRYMLDALKNCEDDKVIIELNSSLTPLIIKPISGDNFLFLVVPARI